MANLKEYIESGVLENYLLGGLSPVEQKAVEAMATQHPEVRAELNAIEDALAIYAQQNAVPMPDGLADKIVSNIDRIQRLESSGNNISKASTGRGLAPLMAIAAAVLLATSLYFFNQNNGLKSQLDDSRTALDSLRNDCDEVKNHLASLQDYLDVVRDPNVRPIIMKGETLDKAPEAIASVLYNEKDQKAYLDIVNLPTPPSDKQYQLWAIVDGVPQSMDVFDVVLGPEGLLEVPFHANAKAFAVTLEPKGGRDQPTTEEMYVIGTLG